MRALGFVAVCCWLLLGCDQVSSTPAQVDAGVPPGWTVISAGSTNLNAVSGVSDSAVWIVGDQGTIFHWDGSHLASESSGTTANLRGVWALDTDRAYAVGDGGMILERTSGLWQQVGAGVTRQVLTGVWADTTRVVAVGSFGTIVQLTPTGYKVVKNADGENLLAVTGTPGGPVTAVGALGLVLNLNAGALKRTAIPAFSKLLSGAASSANGSYAVGQQGTVYQSADSFASPPQPVTGCPQSSLRAVSMAGQDAWIVGWDGAICRVRGTKTTSYPYSDARWFSGIYAASPTSLWVVGSSGTVLHGLPVSTAAADAGVTDAGEGGQ
jgi:photosystem II stability/assembly factor-like uncharacterized protein